VLGLQTCPAIPDSIAVSLYFIAPPVPRREPSFIFSMWKFEVKVLNPYYKINSYF
jgi:hypothetical protein